MLPKKNRADRKTVEKIFKEGRFVNSSNLTLKFVLSHPNSLLIKERGFPQISFLSPKTASKKAVVRNLLRRRGYAILSKHFGKFPVGFLGAFIFGKKSVEVFGGRKNKKYNPILNLDLEVKTILTKLRF